MRTPKSEIRLLFEAAIESSEKDELRREDFDGTHYVEPIPHELAEAAQTYLDWGFAFPIT